MAIGVGYFTIVDDNTVQEADLGVNFFLDESSLGQPRGKRCMELLLELNPEVNGNWSKADKVLGFSCHVPDLQIPDRGDAERRGLIKYSCQISSANNPSP
jgi:hypothetical protein